MALDGGFKWNENTKADNLNWDKNQPSKEKCAVMNNNKMKSMNCETPSNFMCEGNSKPMLVNAVFLYLRIILNFR